MIQSHGYSELDWLRVHASQVQSPGNTVQLGSQWEEKDGLCALIVAKGGRNTPTGQSAPICKVVDRLWSQLNMSYMSVGSNQNRLRTDAHVRCCRSPVQWCSQYPDSAPIRAANATWMSEWITASPAWRCCVSLATSFISQYHLRVMLSGQRLLQSQLLSPFRPGLTHTWMPPFCWRCFHLPSTCFLF